MVGQLSPLQSLGLKSSTRRWTSIGGYSYRLAEVRAPFDGSSLWVMAKSTAFRLKKLASLTLVCGAVLYPLVMYVGFKTFSPRLVAILFGLMAIVGAVLKKCDPYTLRLLAPGIGVMLLCLISAFFNRSHFMLYLPVLISVNLLISFGYTLFRPPSMVAIFAQQTTAITFNDEQLRYCRLVTLIWVIFFVFNGTAAGLTACCAALEVWSLYNGLIAYGIMGLLFTVELFYRHWRFRCYVGLPTDAFFKKLFPPQETSQQRET